MHYRITRPALAAGLAAALAAPVLPLPSAVLASTLILPALWLAAPARAAAPEPVPGANLESLLAWAHARNPELAGMRDEARAASERIGPAGALPDPRLRIELQDLTMSGNQNPSLSPARVGSTRYTLMQDVPWFGKRDLQRAIAEQEAESANGRTRETWAELSARLKAAYAQYYAVDQNQRLTGEILDLLNRLEQLAQARYAGGLAAQTDAIRAQMEQTSMRAELIALESERRAAVARLNRLLARAPDAPLAAPQTLRALPAPARLDYGALAERLRASNPTLYGEAARVQAAEKNRALTYRNRYPDFTVGIAPIQIRNAIGQWEVMVELNIPLQQSTRRAKEREAEAMLSAAQAKKASAADQLLGELAENLAALEASRRTDLLAASALLPQAELTFKSALASYENGKVDFATLLEAQRQSRQARLTHIRAQAESQARLAEIERLLGEDL